MLQLRNHFVYTGRGSWFGRHKFITGILLVLILLGILGSVTRPRTKAQPAIKIGTAVVPVKPIATGWHLITSDAGKLGCAQVLPVGADTGGLAALTVNPTSSSRSSLFMWQIAGQKATITPGLSWDVIVYWLAGGTVEGSAIVKPGSYAVSPLPITAAIAVPVALIPYHLPTSVKVGGPCVPA